VARFALRHLGPAASATVREVSEQLERSTPASQVASGKSLESRSYFCPNLSENLAVPDFALASAGAELLNGSASWNS
jgi:acetone carboxylase gamma subunit